uniref:Uncharacterized protein n=3 Tax=Noccaea caerulescens TaxID=107243 RepID=A0A1J3D9J6_NOCCA
MGAAATRGGCLLAQGGGGDHQVDAHAKQHHDQASPSDQALGAELVAVARLRPGVGGVDRAVAVHVGAVLVGEPVHAVALALAALGVPPVLGLHGLGAAHQVQLDGLILDGVQTLLVDVDLLAAAGHHHGAHALAGAGGLHLQAAAHGGLGGQSLHDGDV